MTDHLLPDADRLDVDALVARLRAPIETTRDEAELTCRPPDALVTALRDAGALDLLTPRALGGAQCSHTTVLRVYEELGRIDASAAWIVWNANFGFVGALLGTAGRARIWGTGRRPVFANSGSPGTAVPVEDGLLVSGHWKIVSGIDAADWFFALAVVTDGDRPRLDPDGGPDVRIVVLGRDQVTVKDTWDVSGLRGSGSNDVVADRAPVPADLALGLLEPPRIAEFPYTGFVPALVFPGCTAVVLGVAQAAVDEVVRIAATRTTAPTRTPLAEQTHAQSVIGRSESALAAARLLLRSAAAGLDRTSAAGEPVTAAQRAALRAAMSHAATVSREVLLAMYELGSSASVYRGNPLERLFRDGMVALQHANHSAAYFALAGRVRLGLDPGLGFF
ncbi:acyl-CoA dehydrogenase [Pseudonocardia sp. CNS-139]|nr:acyl-CoA dehydrogenase [Pseudonocardia sp. CNS-139]